MNSNFDKIEEVTKPSIQDRRTDYEKLISPKLREPFLNYIHYQITTLLKSKVKVRKDFLNKELVQNKDLTAQEKADYIEELYTINDRSVLSQYGLENLLGEVKQIISDRINSYDMAISARDKFIAERDQIIESLRKKHPELSERELQRAALKVYQESKEFKRLFTKTVSSALTTMKDMDQKREYFQLMLQFSDELLQDCRSRLERTLQCKIDQVTMSVKSKEHLQELENREIDQEIDDDPNEDTDTVRQDTYESYRLKNPIVSISAELKAFLSTITLRNFDGSYIPDIMDNPQYLDTTTAYSRLASVLSNMTSVQDFQDFLNRNGIYKAFFTQYPWLSYVVTELNKPENEQLKSTFYHKFRTDRLEYWVQKTETDSQGNVLGIKTMQEGNNNTIWAMLNEFESNIVRGITLNASKVSKKGFVSCYDYSGKPIKENIDKIKTIISDIRYPIYRVSLIQTMGMSHEDTTANARKESLKYTQDIHNLLRSFGINITLDNLKKTLANDIDQENINRRIGEIPALGILDYLLQICNNTLEAKKATNLYEMNKRSYISIANLLNYFQQAPEDIMVKSGDKSYSRFVTPNALGTLIKKLKNVSQNDPSFKKFLNESFFKYDWFKRGDSIMCGWLREIANNPKARQALQHKVLLAKDNVPYEKWSSLDYLVANITEFFSTEGYDKNTAWYSFPVISNVKTAEYIRFLKYSQEECIDNLIDTVRQEFNRIMLVRNRANKKGLTKIKNFDIDEAKGSVGGAEFKFFPELNTWSQNGRTFIDTYAEIAESNPENLKDFIRDTLNSIMENRYQDFLRNAETIGLLEESSDGFYKNFAIEGNRIKSNESIRRNKQKLATTILTILNSHNLTYPQSLVSVAQTGKVTMAQIQELQNFLNTLSPEIKVQFDANKFLKTLNEKGSIDKKLREYFYNSEYATSQILELTINDPALYSSWDDICKRIKEVYSPTQKLDVSAKYNGEKLFEDPTQAKQRSITIKDPKMISTTIKEIETLIKNQLGDTIEADFIISQYKKIDIADGQAYRTLDSYRKVLIMAGKWGSPEGRNEQAYQHIKNGTWTIEDFMTVWQSIKPFTFSHKTIASGVANRQGQEVLIKSSEQHKDSEFVLLAMASTMLKGKKGSLASNIHSSQTLLALDEFMTKNDIDVVIMDSASKVATHGIINLEGLSTKEAMIKHLEQVTGVSHGVLNADYVSELSFEDYGLQTSTPEHFWDRDMVLGVQIRRIMTADIPADASITLYQGANKVTKTKTEWLSDYNEIITRNLLDSAKDFSQEFSDTKEGKQKLSDFLKSQLAGSELYSKEMVEAVSLDENGNFRIPLYDPSICDKLQSLMLSLFRSRVINQKVKGGTCIQVSCYGFSDKEELKIQYNKDGSVKCIPCYMPAYTKQYFEQIMDENGEVDLNKVPKNLRDVIGYRVPTEDKYSILPLRIVGFLSPQNGSAIMVSPEITTITGSDFDVDKLFLYMSEFKVVTDFNTGVKKLKRISYAKFDPTTKASTMIPIEEMSKQQRNNYMLDLMIGAMRTPFNSASMINPGGMQKMRDASNLIQIIQSMKAVDLMDLLMQAQTPTVISYVQSIHRGLTINDLPKILTRLTSADLEILSSLVNLNTTRDPLAPQFQVLMQQKNMTGAELIGIYVTQNNNHTLTQHTNLSVTSNGSFALFGKSPSSLNSMYDHTGHLISRNIANFIGAALDVAKENYLYATLQNTITAPISMFLIRLGYSINEVAVFLNQPVLKQIINNALRSKNLYLEINKAMNQMKLTKEDISGLKKSDIVSYEDAVSNIIGESLKKASTFDFTRATTKDKVLVALLSQLNQDSSQLSSLITGTRMDSSSRSVGSSIWQHRDTVENSYMQNYDDPDIDEKRLITTDGYVEHSMDPTSENFMEFCKSQGFLQAFYTCGIEGAIDFMQEHFPYYGEAFNQCIKDFRTMLNIPKFKSFPESLFKMILKELPVYAVLRDMSNNGGPSYFTEGTNSLEQERKEYIEQFPQVFEYLVNNIEELQNMEIIQNLFVDKNNNIVAKTNSIQKGLTNEMISANWLQMLYSENPLVNKLAYDLFKYTVFKYGLGFKFKGFSELAPVVLKENIPGFIQSQRMLQDESFDYKSFVLQFIRHHLGDSNISTVLTDEDIKLLNLDSTNLPETFNKPDFSRNASSAKKELLHRLLFRPVVAINSTETVVDEETGEPQEVTTTTYYINENSLYKTEQDPFSTDPEENPMVSFKRINPLGGSGTMFEYEYGINGMNINSVTDRVEEGLSESQNRAKEQADEYNQNLEEGQEELDTLNLWLQESSKDFISRVWGKDFMESLEKQISHSEEEMVLPIDFKDANDQKLCK